MANTQDRTDRSKSCEISNPACQKTGAKAERNPLMDGKDKCFVSSKIKIKSTKSITEAERG
ncbi:hypothetical protein E2C01_054971 [Portunus trituberculatus]|uniref:Uncharacterized protein n=1 Tax=Portunus trituberculatus TaxID=210409 RepID=A0A5B7GL78_PORTR|nr:hypothetical protein [Portunus trituberculatus]